MSILLPTLFKTVNALHAGTEARPQQLAEGLAHPHSINTGGMSCWIRAMVPGEAQRGGHAGGSPHSRSSPAHRPAGEEAIQHQTQGDATSVEPERWRHVRVKREAGSRRVPGAPNQSSEGHELNWGWGGAQGRGTACLKAWPRERREKASVAGMRPP